MTTTNPLDPNGKLHTTAPKLTCKMHKKPKGLRNDPRSAKSASERLVEALSRKRATT